MPKESRQSAVEDKSLVEEKSSLIGVVYLPSFVEKYTGEELTLNQNVNNVNPKQKGKNL